MIYICIPTHNEQQTVGVVLWKLRQVLTDFPRDYQLLVADDASTDKTPEVLEPYTRVLPLTVIRSERQQGAAASLEMLLREAVRRSEYPKRDVVVTLQADFSDEPDDMVPLVKRLEAGADVAVGNKVSSSKETRARRFARSLARFFVRRQKWPEGVATPFDGYRAYRLYAIKRALEERAGARLVRYDGWAGSAELLKAVLPHARRVDVVDVDDRPDRLQRPRREKPFASAMQVRLMSSGTEPAGLVGVEELDRIAQTASRSRERAAITAQSIHADRGTTRTNGARSRQSGRREPARSRNQGNGTGRSRVAAAESPQRERAQSESRKARPEGRPKTERPPRQKQAEGRNRQPRSNTPSGGSEAAAAEATPEELMLQQQEAGGPAQEAPKPKRKRRRRKRGGQGRSGATERNAGGEPEGQAAVDAAAEAPGNSDVEPASAGGDGADGAEGADGAAPKKRRRRGGRRGGRGRRRPRPDGESSDGSDPGSAGPDSSAGGTATPASAAAGGQRPARDAGPAQERPAQERPVQERPVQERPVQERPVQERPVQEPAARSDND